jgi:predicted nucleic acid-binding protein
VPRSPLLLDACVAINLAAADRIQHIAQAVDVTFTLARQAAAEVGYLRDLADGNLIRTPIDLGQYAGDTLLIIDLTPAEFTVYLSLAREVDDGEAATIAVAAQRGLKLATDDRKARKLCSRLSLPEPLHTLALLRTYADAAALQHAPLRDLLIRVRDRASFQPPRSDPDYKWWQDSIDDP